MQVHVTSHPLLLHKLSHLRKKETSSADFRRIINELSSMLAYEVTRDLTTDDQPIETPLEKTKAPFLNQKITIVSILRAGEGLLPGFMQMLPIASVGRIGLYRDKFIHGTVEYYFKVPTDIEGRTVFLLDPLLATGTTACAAIERLKQYGVGPIRLISLIAAPEGIHLLEKEHPDISVYAIAIDRELSEKGYILPGVGDAGDRLFGTL